MKVAEIFADLGFKVQGADELKQFETTLTNIAQAARNAALALRILARTPIPRNLGRAMAAAQTVQPGQRPATPPPQTNPQGQPPTPPTAPGQKPPPQTAIQGLKQLGMLGLKVAGFAALAMGIKRLISSVTEMTRAVMKATFGVDKFTSQTGMSRQELKQWERVAALSDVKNEELHETMKQLQQRSRAIQQGDGGMNAYYGLLGINPHDRPSDLLRTFAERTRNMEAARAAYIGSQLGISENIAYMLRKNVGRLDELLGTEALSDDEHQAVMRLNSAWKELTFSMTTLRDKIMAEMAPALESMAGWITQAARSGAKDFLRGTPPTNGGSSWLGPMAPGFSVPFIRPSTPAPTPPPVNIYIDGSKDPKATAREAVKELGRTFSDSYYMRPQPTP